MKYLRSAFTAAAIFAASAVIATPAFASATVTVVESNPNLNTKIKADDYNDGNANTVYGSTVDGAHNVLFLGNTAIDITNGNGFATITDITPKDADWYSLLIDPNFDFTQYEFSIALEDAGALKFEYSLGGGVFTTFDTLDGLKHDTDLSFFIDSDTPLDALRITSVASSTVGKKGLVQVLPASTINSVKHNAITYAPNNPPPGGVPEPGTWGMMLIGFAGVGFAARRQRKLGHLRLARVAV